LCKIGYRASISFMLKSLMWHLSVPRHKNKSKGEKEYKKTFCFVVVICVDS